MKVKFYRVFAVNCEDGWELSWSSNYPYADDFHVGTRILAHILEKRLDIKFLEKTCKENFNFLQIIYTPVDEADEAFFLFRIAAIDGEEFEI